MREIDYGFVRVGAVIPKIEVANVEYNLKQILNEIEMVDHVYDNCKILLFPELSLTGYTCGDLFLNDTLIDESLKALIELKIKISNISSIFNGVIIVGLPIRCDNSLYNCAAVIQKGHIIGIVPKTYIPNYEEFYEQRWFSSSTNLKRKTIIIDNEDVPIGTDLLFTSLDNKVKFGIEICEDLWAPKPMHTDLVLNGANIILNPSSSNELIGKYEYRKNLIKMSSARNCTGYVYASSGVNESSTDLLFSGYASIYENGSLLKENKRFNFDNNFIISDIDVDRLNNQRIKNKTFSNSNSDKTFREIHFHMFDDNKEYTTDTLLRKYDKYPFVPSDETERKSRCEEIINIQAYALAKRLHATGIKKCVIGMSGGLDSTLAFLVTIKAFEILRENGLDYDNKNIIGITMPGFGTTDRTYNNAISLMESYGTTIREISIKDACIKHFVDIGLSLDDRSVTYENTQARERTQILMDVANMENALVIGTGDLSELALGWCTYNGDHMSMYAVNSSIPKTLVRYLVEYFMIDSKDEKCKCTLQSILDTPISPELLPPTNNQIITQKTEESVGPYILHDFFLYHFMKYGASPDKISYIATQTFDGMYSKEEIDKWLSFFLKRFFSQQFKRSCMPDGVKVGSISLSPRGDLRMPSDASSREWTRRLK